MAAEPSPAPKFTVHEMPAFAKWVKKNRLASAVAKLRDELAANPDAGDPIVGGSGLRKVRMAGLGRGKSGGFRVIYILFVGRTAALLLDGYSKSEKEDLTDDELKALVKATAGLEAAVAELRETRPEDDA